MDGRNWNWGEQDQAILSVLRLNLLRLHRLADDWLNTGHFSSIPDRFRLLYAFVCALRAKLEHIAGHNSAALRACDEGLLKGNDLEDVQGGGLLAAFASLLCCQFLPPPKGIDEMLAKECPPAPPALANSVPITVRHLPPLESFYTEFFQPELPLIIRGMVNQWPAFQKWSFLWLNQICGHRLVPVELGNKYTDEDWRQQLMGFGHFLRQFVFPEDKEQTKSDDQRLPGYMAQHRLLDQVPDLLADLPLPDYCSFGHIDSNGKGEGEQEETMNVFIGPGGTLSPLHNDPRHNLFCQIRGRKFVRLIAPSQREHLYLFDDLMRQNTSQVDVEQPDLTRFPCFVHVKCHDFLMEAGDCLFIPRDWFHHIRALEPCISVSIWFGQGGK